MTERVTRHDAPGPANVRVQRTDAEWTVLETKLKATELALVNAHRELAALRAEMLTQKVSDETPVSDPSRDNATVPDVVVDAMNASREKQRAEARERGLR